MLMRHPTLYGKYTVVKFDNVHFEPHATLKFSAMEGSKVRVHGTVSNTFNGVLTRVNGTLKGPVMSTMMYGSERQMALESALMDGFDSGMTYKVKDDGVTLTTRSHTIILQRQ